MALRVPPPDKARITAAPVAPHMYNQPVAAPVADVDYQVGLDGLVEFDGLPVEHVRFFSTCIALYGGLRGPMADGELHFRCARVLRR
jgi:hypothetical protein